MFEPAYFYDSRTGYGGINRIIEDGPTIFNSLIKFEGTFIDR